MTTRFMSNYTPPAAPLISTEVMKQLAPKIHPLRAKRLAELFSQICPIYGMDTPDILHEFMARLLVECVEFTRYEENLNYSAKRLMQVWPSRFKTLEEAKLYQHDSRKLAEKVYGMRKDLGNTLKGDGFTFRGSGPIQLTGRGIVTAFAYHMEKNFAIKKTPEQWAETVRINDEWAIHSACWVFAIAKGLVDEAINDNLKLIVKRINGAYHGLAETEKYYELCKKLI